MKGSDLDSVGDNFGSHSFSATTSQSAFKERSQSEECVAYSIETISDQGMVRFVSQPDETEYKSVYGVQLKVGQSSLPRIAA